jgi:hypothetical protein
MKRTLFALSAVLLLSATSSWAAPLEFYAKVVAKNPVDSLNTTLRVAITPSVEIDVAVTTRTDIKDTEGNPISIDEVEIGALVEIEAAYTPGGFLALEVQLQLESDGFEIKGILQSIQTIPPESIQVQGFTILVIPETRILDENREPMTLEDLSARLAAAGPAGLLVKVKGLYQEAGLAASHIKILPHDGFAKISLQGIISAVLSEVQFTLDIGGGTEVLVNILPETEIVGDPVAGLYVKVIGQLAPDLSVNALRVRVVGLFELSPDELEMDYGQTRTVTVLLRVPLEDDLVLQIASEDSSLALPSTDSITIPAGDLSGTFDVTAGDADGRTVISVAAGEAFGGYTRRLKVEVGEDATGPRELELMWTPRVIRAAPQGRVSVRLMLKYGVAPEDIPIPLVLEESTGGLQIRFPDEVILPKGEKAVSLEFLFGSQSGSGKLVATLPDTLGGDSAELDIDLRSNSQAPLKVSWSEKKIEFARSTAITVDLRLSRIAEKEIAVVITPVAGDAGVLSSFLSPVTIPAGEQVVHLTFQSSEKSGKVRLRAALPRELGGAHADLDLRVD